MEFVGRAQHLGRLRAYLDDVATSGRGRMLAIRGRRQVGKSRLVTEFIERAATPQVFFTAIKNASPAQQLQAFRNEVFVASAPLPDASVLFGANPTDWGDIFGRLRLASAQGPVIVVLDEVPWLVEGDATFEGRLQAAWDSHLQHLPVLLILIGSDLAMMERLTAHDRPLYGRAREYKVGPFNPAEVAKALAGRASALDAFDAYLATGGYPRLVEDYARSGSLSAFIADQFGDENSDLVVMAQRSLDAEFTPDAQARRVLTAIGGHAIGLATFSSAVAALPESGKAAETGLTRALQLLVNTTRVVAVERPALSAPGTRLKRYRIDDPYLRLWFRFIEPHIAAIARGRSDVAIRAFHDGWSAWRGVAIEPVVHDALILLAPEQPLLTGVRDIASWWNRNNSVEVDIAAVNAGAVVAVGSIKWRERRLFSAQELATLAEARAQVPHAAAASLIAICPAGARADVHPDLLLTADDLLDAWRPGTPLPIG